MATLNNLVYNAEINYETTNARGTNYRFNKYVFSFRWQADILNH